MNLLEIPSWVPNWAVEVILGQSKPQADPVRLDRIAGYQTARAGAFEAAADAVAAQIASLNRAVQSGSGREAVASLRQLETQLRSFADAARSLAADARADATNTRYAIAMIYVTLVTFGAQFASAAAMAIFPAAAPAAAADVAEDEVEARTAVAAIARWLADQVQQRAAAGAAERQGLVAALRWVSGVAGREGAFGLTRDVVFEAVLGGGSSLVAQEWAGEPSVNWDLVAAGAVMGGAGRFFGHVAGIGFAKAMAPVDEKVLGSLASNQVWVRMVRGAYGAVGMVGQGVVGGVAGGVGGAVAAAPLNGGMPSREQLFSAAFSGAAGAVLQAGPGGLQRFRDMVVGPRLRIPPVTQAMRDKQDLLDRPRVMTTDGAMPTEDEAGALYERPLGAEATSGGVAELAGALGRETEAGLAGVKSEPALSEHGGDGESLADLLAQQREDEESADNAQRIRKVYAALDHRMGGLSGDDVVEMSRHGGQLQARLAEIEITRRVNISDREPDGKTVTWQQLMAADVLSTRGHFVEGVERAEANQKQGEGKTLSLTLHVLAELRDGGVVHLLTNDAGNANRDYDMWRGIMYAVGGDVYRMNPDVRMPAPVDGRATLYVGTMDDEAHAINKGNLVPGRYRVLDEDDAIEIWNDPRFVLAAGSGKKAPDYVARYLTDIDKLFLRLTDNGGGLDKFGFVEVDGRHVELTDEARVRVEKRVRDYFSDDGRAGDRHRAQRWLAKRSAKLPAEYRREGIGEDVHRLTVAAQAHWDVTLDDDFLIDEHEPGKKFVRLINTATGWVMFDRETGNGSTYQGGLHQALEAAYGATVHDNPTILASIDRADVLGSKYSDRVVGISGTNDGVRVPRRAESRLEVSEEFTRTRAEKFDLIAGDVVEHWTSGRPQVVICDNNSEARPIYRRVLELASGKGVEDCITLVDGQTQCMTKEQLQQKFGVDTFKEYWKQVVADAGKNGKILIVTRIGSRGTHIHIDADLEAVGGLTIRLTGHSVRSPDLDEQAYTRAGRTGPVRNPDGTVTITSQQGTSVFYTSLDDPILARGGPQIETIKDAYTNAGDRDRADAELGLSRVIPVLQSVSKTTTLTAAHVATMNLYSPQQLRALAEKKQLAALLGLSTPAEPGTNGHGPAGNGHSANSNGHGTGRQSDTTNTNGTDHNGNTNHNGSGSAFAPHSAPPSGGNASSARPQSHPTGSATALADDAPTAPGASTTPDSGGRAMNFTWRTAAVLEKYQLPSTASLDDALTQIRGEDAVLAGPTVMPAEWKGTVPPAIDIWTGEASDPPTGTDQAALAKTKLADVFNTRRVDSGRPTVGLFGFEAEDIGVAVFRDILRMLELLSARNPGKEVRSVFAEDYEDNEAHPGDAHDTTFARIIPDETGTRADLKLRKKLLSDPVALAELYRTNVLSSEDSTGNVTLYSSLAQFGDAATPNALFPSGSPLLMILAHELGHFFGESEEEAVAAALAAKAVRGDLATPAATAAGPTARVEAPPVQAPPVDRPVLLTPVPAVMVAGKVAVAVPISGQIGAATAHTAAPPEGSSVSLTPDNTSITVAEPLGGSQPALQSQPGNPMAPRALSNPWQRVVGQTTPITRPVASPWGSGTPEAGRPAAAAVTAPRRPDPSRPAPGDVAPSVPSPQPGRSWVGIVRVIVHVALRLWWWLWRRGAGARTGIEPDGARRPRSGTRQRINVSLPVGVAGAAVAGSAFPAVAIAVAGADDPLVLSHGPHWQMDGGLLVGAAAPPARPDSYSSELESTAITDGHGDRVSDVEPAQPADDGPLAVDDLGPEDADEVFIVLPDIFGTPIQPPEWFADNPQRRLLVHLPGFGRTPPRPGQRPGDVARAIHDTVVDRIGSQKRFGIIAHGTGGPYGLGLAALAGDQVTVLHLVDPPSPAQHEPGLAGVAADSYNDRVADVYAALFSERTSSRESQDGPGLRAETIGPLVAVGGLGASLYHHAPHLRSAVEKFIVSEIGERPDEFISAYLDDLMAPHDSRRMTAEDRVRRNPSVFARSYGDDFFRLMKKKLRDDPEWVAGSDARRRLVTELRLDFLECGKGWWLGDPGYRARAETAAEITARQGWGGVRDVCLALNGDWGVDPAGITAGLLVTCGKNGRFPNVTALLKALPAVRVWDVLDGSYHMMTHIFAWAEPATSHVVAEPRQDNMTAPAPPAQSEPAITPDTTSEPAATEQVAPAKRSLRGWLSAQRGLLGVLWADMVSNVFGGGFRSLVTLIMAHSPGWAGVVLAAFLAPQALMSIPAGIVSARFDYRAIVRVSKIVALLGMGMQWAAMALGVAQAVVGGGMAGLGLGASFAVGVFVTQSAAVFARSALNASVTQALPREEEEQTKGQQWFEGREVVGGLVGRYVDTVLFHLFPELPLALYAAMTVVDFAASLRWRTEAVLRRGWPAVVRGLPRAVVGAPVRWVRGAVRVVRTVMGSDGIRSEVPQAWREMRQHQPVLIACSCTSALVNATGGFLSVRMALLVANELASVQGLVFAAAGAGGLLALLGLVRWLTSRWKAEVVFPPTQVGVVAAGVLQAVVQLPLTAVGVATEALGQGLFSVFGIIGNVAVDTRVATLRTFAQVQGLMRAISGVGGMIGALAAGPVLQAIGIGATGWIAVAGVGVAALLTNIILHRFREPATVQGESSDAAADTARRLGPENVVFPTLQPASTRELDDRPREIFDEAVDAACEWARQELVRYWEYRLTRGPVSEGDVDRWLDPIFRALQPALGLQGGAEGRRIFVAAVEDYVKAGLSQPPAALTRPRHRWSEDSRNRVGEPDPDSRDCGATVRGLLYELQLEAGGSREFVPPGPLEWPVVERLLGGRLIGVRIGPVRRLFAWFLRRDGQVLLDRAARDLARRRVVGENGRRARGVAADSIGVVVSDGVTSHVVVMTYADRRGFGWRLLRRLVGRHVVGRVFGGRVLVRDAAVRDGVAARYIPFDRWKRTHAYAHVTGVWTTPYVRDLDGNGMPWLLRLHNADGTDPQQLYRDFPDMPQTSVAGRQGASTHLYRGLHIRTWEGSSTRAGRAARAATSTGSPVGSRVADAVPRWFGAAASQLVGDWRFLTAQTSKVFRRLVWANIVSEIGDGIFRYGIPIIVKLLTGSAADVGLVSAAANVSGFFRIPIGALVDRVDNWRLMRTAAMVGIAVNAVLAVGWQLGFWGGLGHVGVVAVLMGVTVAVNVVGTVMGAAKENVARTMFPNEDGSQRAQKFQQQEWALLGTVLPLVGATIAGFGMQGLFLANIVSYLGFATIRKSGEMHKVGRSIADLRPNRTVRQRLRAVVPRIRSIGRSATWQNAGKGIAQSARIVWTDPVLRWSTAINVATTWVWTTQAIILVDRLGGTPLLYGILTAVACVAEFVFTSLGSGLQKRMSGNAEAATRATFGVYVRSMIAGTGALAGIIGVFVAGINPLFGVVPQLLLGLYLTFKGLADRSRQSNNDVVPQEVAARVAGFRTTIGTVGAVVGSLGVAAGSELFGVLAVGEAAVGWMAVLTAVMAGLHLWRRGRGETIHAVDREDCGATVHVLLHGLNIRPGLGPAVRRGPVEWPVVERLLGGRLIGVRVGDEVAPRPWALVDTVAADLARGRVVDGDGRRVRGVVADSVGMVVSDGGTSHVVVLRRKRRFFGLLGWSVAVREGNVSGDISLRRWKREHAYPRVTGAWITAYRRGVDGVGVPVFGDDDPHNLHTVSDEFDPAQLHRDFPDMPQTPVTGGRMPTPARRSILRRAMNRLRPGTPNLLTDTNVTGAPALDEVDQPGRSAWLSWRWLVSLWRRFSFDGASAETRQLLPLLQADMVSNIFTGGMRVLLPILILKLTGSTTLEGWVLSAFLAPLAVMPILLGALVKEYNNKRVLKASRVIGVVATAVRWAALAIGMHGLALGLVFIVGTFVAMSAAELGRAALRDALNKTLTKEQKPMAGAWFQSRENAASLLGRPIGLILWATASVLVPFELDAVTSLGELVVLRRLSSETPRHRGLSATPRRARALDPRAWRQTVHSVGEELNKLHRGVRQDLPEAWLLVRAHRVLLSAALTSAVTNAAGGIITIVVTQLIRHNSLAVQDMVFAASGVGGFIGIVWFLKLMRQLNPRWATLVAQVGQLVSIVLQALVHPIGSVGQVSRGDIAQLTAGGAGMSLFGHGGNLVVDAYKGMNIPEEYFPPVNALMTAIPGIGGLMGGPLGALLVEAIGVGKAGWLAVAAMGVSTAVTHLVLYAYRRQLPQKSQQEREQAIGLQPDLVQRLAPTWSGPVSVPGGYLWVHKYGPETGAKVVVLPDILGSRFGPRPSADWLNDNGDNGFCYTVIEPAGGNSPRRPRQSVKDMARDVLAVIDNLGYQHVGMLGIGTGAPIAEVAARMATGNRVKRIVLVGGPAPSEGGKIATDGPGMAQYPIIFDSTESMREVVLDRLRKFVDRVGEDADGYLSTLQSRNKGAYEDLLIRFPHWRSTLLQAVAEGVRKGVDSVWDRVLAISRDWELDDVPAFDDQQEVRILHGGNDGRFGLFNAYTNAARINGQLHVVPRANEFEILASVPEQLLWIGGAEPLTSVVREESVHVVDEQSRKSAFMALRRGLDSHGWYPTSAGSAESVLDALMRRLLRQGADATVNVEFPDHDLVRIVLDTGRPHIHPMYGNWTDVDLRSPTREYLDLPPLFFYDCVAYRDDGAGRVYLEYHDPSKERHLRASDRVLIASGVSNLVTQILGESEQSHIDNARDLVVSLVSALHINHAVLVTPKDEGGEQSLTFTLSSAIGRATVVVRTPSVERLRADMELEVELDRSVLGSVALLIGQALAPLADQRSASVLADVAVVAANGFSEPHRVPLTVKVQLSTNSTGGHAVSMTVSDGSRVVNMGLTTYPDHASSVRLKCSGPVGAAVDLLVPFVIVATEGNSDGSYTAAAEHAIAEQLWDTEFRESRGNYRIDLSGTATAGASGMVVHAGATARTAGSAAGFHWALPDINVAADPGTMRAVIDPLMVSDAEIHTKKAIVDRLPAHVLCAGWRDQRIAAVEVESVLAIARAIMGDANGELHVAITGSSDKMLDFVPSRGGWYWPYATLLVAREALLPEPVELTTSRRLSAFDRRVLRALMEGRVADIGHITSVPSVLAVVWGRVPDFPGKSVGRVRMLRSRVEAIYREGRVVRESPRALDDCGPDTVEVQFRTRTPGKDVGPYVGRGDAGAFFFPLCEFRVDRVTHDVEFDSYIIEQTMVSPYIDSGDVYQRDLAETEGWRLRLEVHRRVVSDRIREWFELRPALDRDEVRELADADSMFVHEDIDELDGLDRHIAQLEEEAAECVRRSQVDGAQEAMPADTTHDRAPRMALLVNAIYYYVRGGRRAVHVPDKLVAASEPPLSVLSLVDVEGRKFRGLGAVRRSVGRIDGQGVMFEEVDADGKAGSAFFAQKIDGDIMVWNPLRPGKSDWHRMLWEDFVRTRPKVSYRGVVFDNHGNRRSARWLRLFGRRW